MIEGTLGVILAGGSSSRMGRDKATVEIDGAAMIDHVASALTRLVAAIVVVGRASAPDGATSVPDPGPPHQGPLAGLSAALHHAQAAGFDRVVVVGVDQPYVRAETLQSLCELGPDLPAVPVDGARQVTCAVYPTRLAAEAERELLSGGSIQTLLDRIAHHAVSAAEWEAWAEDGRSWFSIDRPEDVERARLRFGSIG